MLDNCRIATLKKHHGELDEELEREQKRPLPNFLRLSDLKRRKLRIKDQLAFLSRA